MIANEGGSEGEEGKKKSSKKFPFLEKKMYFCKIDIWKIMQAFLLAAGLGTRLRPLTNNRPKALVEVNGVPLLKINIDNLVRQGFSRIVVNTHHFSEMVVNYIKERSWDAEILISDESDMLLDTGGGLKHASKLFLPDEPILIHNVDILSRINFAELLSQHSHNMNFATLVVSQRETSRYLLFNQEKQLIGWQNKATGETKWTSEPTEHFDCMAFSGIAVINPQLLELLPEADHPYPIVPSYLEISKHHRISYFIYKKEDWLDVGKPETLKQAQLWNLF